MNRYANPENFAHPIRTPLLREHYVYRVFNTAGELLYVGCSYRPVERLKAHRHARAAWRDDVAKVTFAGPYNYETAREVERQAIDTEGSLYNMTPQRRAVERAHSNIVNREIRGLRDWGWHWRAAHERAEAIATELVPYPSHHAAYRVTWDDAERAREANREHARTWCQEVAA